MVRISARGWLARRTSRIERTLCLAAMVQPGRIWRPGVVARVAMGTSPISAASGSAIGRARLAAQAEGTIHWME